MPEFQLKIAGLTAAVRSIYESTPFYFHRYITQEPPEVVFTVTREDIGLEGKLWLEEALEEGFRVRNFPEPFLERAAIQRKFAEALLQRDTLLFHGSAVAVDGRGYLFTAPSGTGKSTHTRLWCQTFGSRALVVNDDQPFLKITEQGIWVCGSPWSGKHGLDTNIQVPLQDICLLERGQENRIRKLELRDSAFLEKQCRRPMTREGERKFRELVDRLGSVANLWHMTCTKDVQAAKVAYRAMSGKEETV